MTKPLVPWMVFVFVQYFLKVQCDDLLNKYAVTNERKDKWREFGKCVGFALKNCRNSDISKRAFILHDCLRNNIFDILDRIMDEDVITVCRGVQFVKYRNQSDFGDKNWETKARSSEIDETKTDWESRAMGKISELFRTHVIKIRLGEFFELQEGRRRRHHMMPLLIFATIALGMILIPMGFKFLAVLGGKALLLAKMALLLSSIQGLKRIATSNFNYGLYQAPPHPLANWRYDRQWYNENNPQNHKFEDPSAYNHLTDQQYNLFNNIDPYQK